MLSDNIRYCRKKNNMSQDELAEKLGVSRQSISLWETGQTQPTIDNIIALTKIFNVSFDTLLGNANRTFDIIDYSHEKIPSRIEKKKNNKRGIIAIIVAAAVIIGSALLFLLLRNSESKNKNPDNSTGNDPVFQSENSPVNGVHDKTGSEIACSNVADKNDKPTASVKPKTIQDVNNNKPTSPPEPKKPQEVNGFDLFSYCKDFAIKKGTLNGDYCIYQQPATRYGGYKDEYFSISYWGDSDMVEFCLHCPLSDAFSINFYLRMRGKYDKKYEYLSSSYYRDSGKSCRSATGYIDPAVFSDKYPLSCDRYEGSADGQNEFMEESRVGICDLIHCLKKFVEVENMECDFSAFEFVNF